MRMRDVARFFDRNPAYDGYTGDFLFNCSYSNFDDVQGDGSTNRRRTLAVDPSLTAPARGVVLLGAQRWLMGDPTDDAFEGDITRHTFNVKRVTDLLAVLTPAQACLYADGAGLPCYVSKLYFRQTVNMPSDTELDSFWNVFFNRSETVAKGGFLRDESGVFFRVRTAYRTPEGFNIVQCDELDADAWQPGVVFQTGGYDPIADKMAAGSVTTNVLQFEPFKFYRFEQQAESQLKPGDRTVFVAASALTPKVGTQFSMLGRNWQVVLVKQELDAHALLARLA